VPGREYGEVLSGVENYEKECERGRAAPPAGDGKRNVVVPIQWQVSPSKTPRHSKPLKTGH